MRKTVPSPGGLSQVIVPPWAVDNLVDDRQSQSGAGCRGFARHAEELLEDVRQVLGGNSDAGVGDGQA